jgi:hypothetical protein
MRAGVGRSLRKCRLGGQDEHAGNDFGYKCGGAAKTEIIFSYK